MVSMVRACFLLSLALPLPAAFEIVPTPHYLEPLPRPMRVAAHGSMRIVERGSAKLRLGAEFLRHQIALLEPSIRVSIGTGDSSGPAIYLWDFSRDPHPPVELNELDRQALRGNGHFGQAYVVRVPDGKSVWVIGASEQGALFGCMSLMQLLRRGASGVEIPGAYIRDYPDFEFRAAADWLLNVEINRWALDRGQGIESFAALCERKLDQALRFKINMVLIDGFGWGLAQRFPGYGELMRRLNRYARARGIHLIYGGYGASYGIAYQSGPLYEEGAYLGQVFRNRESYPDGAIYRCMGFPSARRDVDPATLGSCRANEDLNRLKAEELRQFVEAVEPGALYIHHEDFGGFRGTEKVWKERCARCRKRWPNDSLAAADGGAGGLANGYAALIRAVNRVKDAATGYDASRDCQIILVSPVYEPDSPQSEDWSNVLELWRNIGTALPQANNVQVCFREVFPQNYGGRSWLSEFHQGIRQAGLNLGVYLFFAGGADQFLSDYPTSGAPVMNALFEGARSVYNASGDFYQEPMEGLNAEYSWNIRSEGLFRDPRSYREAVELRRRFMYGDGQPPELFASGGLFAKVCELLYGSAAGPILAEYYRESAWVPDRDVAPEGTAHDARSSGYLPMTWNRAYAAASHWRHLALDSKTWGPAISNAAYARAAANLGLDAGELHRRLAHRWEVVAALNRNGAEAIRKALAVEVSPESAEDLQFLRTSFQVNQPWPKPWQPFTAE